MLYRGSEVLFGHYPQTECGEKQPVEWIIVELKDGIATLISKYVLDKSAWNDEANMSAQPVGRKPGEELRLLHWKVCELRKKLAKTYMREMFSQGEQEMLIPKRIEVPRIGIIQNNVLRDSVWQLSPEEIKQLIPDKELLRGIPTPYALAKGVATNGRYQQYPDERVAVYSPWWTRMSGDEMYSAVVVNASGELETVDSRRKSIGVRPVIRVATENLREETEQTAV